MGTSPNRVPQAFAMCWGKPLGARPVTPGPLRAFYERICARRGPQVAITALARKLVTLLWHLLTRDEDYAFAEPSRVRAKRRALELKAGSPPHKGRSGPDGPVSPAPAQRVADWCQAASTSNRRARELPALVIGPRVWRAPDWDSLGVRPR